jgi:curved DNA-binding protein CbpA
VLGVAPGASAEEIRSAYQKLIQQYHPDRVAGMGPELRELAEQRTKELNAAYDALKRS